jgi:hypothetical protein
VPLPRPVAKGNATHVPGGGALKAFSYPATHANYRAQQYLDLTTDVRTRERSLATHRSQAAMAICLEAKGARSALVPKEKGPSRRGESPSLIAGHETRICNAFTYGLG